MERHVACGLITNYSYFSVKSWRLLLILLPSGEVLLMVFDAEKMFKSSIDCGEQITWEGSAPLSYLYTILSNCRV